MNGSHRVVLALGSNLGDSPAILIAAVEEISEFVTEIRSSCQYRTAPVGGPSQPDYLNSVLIGVTHLRQEELLTRLQEIETNHWRQRRERWGARTLDLDLIDFDSLRWQSETLILPHPRAHERAFVLVPWNEVDPEAILIGHGSVRSLLADVDASGVKRA
jgi:2-amino-4-hydroxy-6-hydroxymethyldihydropteridine diphosphokinase